METISFFFLPKLESPETHFRVAFSCFSSCEIASASTGGEGLNQRRSHLRTGARVCNDVRGPTRIWTLLVAKFASRRRHNLGDPLLKEAASTCFGGPLIFVVMVIGSETEQLRFRGNFSEVATSVLEVSFRLIYNTRNDTFRTEAFIFDQLSITFCKKSSVPTQHSRTEV